MTKAFWTVDEWIEEFGEYYGLHNKRYVQRCCAGETLHPHGTAYQYTYSLPEGWYADKIPGGRGIFIIKTKPGFKPPKVDKNTQTTGKRKASVLSFKKRSK